MTADTGASCALGSVMKYPVAAATVMSAPTGSHVANRENRQLGVRFGRVGRAVRFLRGRGNGMTLRMSYRGKVG